MDDPSLCVCVCLFVCLFVFAFVFVSDTVLLAPDLGVAAIKVRLAWIPEISLLSISTDLLGAGDFSLCRMAFVLSASEIR